MIRYVRARRRNLSAVNRLHIIRGNALFETRRTKTKTETRSVRALCGYSPTLRGAEWFISAGAYPAETLRSLLCYRCHRVAGAIPTIVSEGSGTKIDYIESYIVLSTTELGVDIIGLLW